jgi:hypothetical protein
MNLCAEAHKQIGKLYVIDLHYRSLWDERYFTQICLLKEGEMVLYLGC